MNTRIKGFDGLRAIAALMVFATHRAPRAFPDLGGWGVWLFFALSGFLVVSILHSARRKIEVGEISFLAALGDFTLKRTLRLFPAYYTTLMVLTVLGATGLWVRDWNPAAQFFNFAYLANFWPALHGWPGAYSHLWSLAVEWQFYMLGAPVLLLLPARLHLRACLAVAGLGVAFHIGGLAVGISERMALYPNSLINFGYLALGGAAALAPKTGRPMWLRGDAALLALGIIYTGLWILAAKVESLGPSLLAPLLAPLIITTLFLTQDGWLCRALEIAPLRWLGTVSYGFYLFHNFIAVEPFGRGHGIAAAGNIAVDLALTIGLAALSWRLIEHPAMASRKRLEEMLRRSFASGRRIWAAPDQAAN